MQCAPNGEVVRFVEKPRVEMVRSPFDLANAAVFVVERAIFADVKFSRAADFSRDVFEPAVTQRLAKIYGFSIGSAGYRYDLGTPERLFEANMNVLAGRWDAPIPGRESRPGIWIESGVMKRGARIVAPAVVGRGAHLGLGSTVGPMAVVGEGCIIGRGASVQHSVLMARSRIGKNARVERCFVGSDSTIGSHIQLPAGSLLGDFARIGTADDQDR
jgi:NDP-sugar pyrophosphorylase family protein